MGKSRQDGGRVATDQAAGRGFNPFARLLQEAGLAPAPREPGDAAGVPAGEPAAPTLARAASGPVTAGGRPARLTVRAERKGHGGKTVTRVGGLAGDDDALEALAGRMRRALGCGVRVEDGELLAQGDLVPRVEAWLKENLHQ